MKEPVNSQIRLKIRSFFNFLYVCDVMKRSLGFSVGLSCSELISIIKFAFTQKENPPGTDSVAGPIVSHQLASRYTSQVYLDGGETGDLSSRCSERGMFEVEQMDVKKKVH